MGGINTKPELILAGLISMLIGAVAISVVFEPIKVVAGGIVLMAAVVGLFLVGRTQRIVALALVTVGVGALVVALWMGARPEPADALAVNQDLIAMLAAVSFIELITDSGNEARSRRTGAAAVWRTAGVVHLLGSVINVSALNIVGDRLGRGGALRFPEALLLSRAFAACAFWSPFWAAAAAALAYAPGAKIHVLAVCGLILAVASLSISIHSVVRRFGDELADYHGYVPSWRLLRVPLVLVAIVLAAHGTWPHVAIPNIVLLGAVGVTALVVTFTAGRSAPGMVVRHAGRVLPRMRAELTLFAAAGVLAVGLGQYFEVARIPMPITEFTVATAWLCTVVMVGFSLVGVHPVISIAAIATIVAPIGPDPTLFAMASMIAWGAAATVGPVSGLNIYLNGRFGIDNFAVAARNLPLVLVVLALAGPVLLLCDFLS